MTKLIPVVVISMILAVASHKKSDFSQSAQRYRKKDTVFYTIMAIVMILFVGLRTWYNDTVTYIQSYETLNPLDSVIDTVTDWSLGSNPGYNLVNGIMRILGVSTQGFLLIYAAATNGIYLWFLRKYTNNIWQTVFLFVVLGVYSFTLAAIKQCIAVAIGLLAIDQALKKHYVRFVFWVLVAITFHPYAVMFFVVPFLVFRPWSAKTYLSLAIFGLAGILLESLLGTIVDVTSMFGEGYDIEEFAGEGVNPFRLAVSAVPLILSWIARHRIAQMDEQQEREYYLFTNLSILNAEIMFVALFGTANYFARLANYFLIFQALSIPWMFQFFEKKSRQLLVCLAVLCYCLFFIYENGINRNFDAECNSITLVDYLLSLF